MTVSLQLLCMINSVQDVNALSPFDESKIKIDKSQG